MNDHPIGDKSLRTILLSAFALSGAAALVYEVVWTRSLALTLGSTTYAVSTMLATFMGGLALGAIWGGRRADRGGDLLGAFAFCELGIGIAGMLSVPVIYHLPALYLPFATEPGPLNTDDRPLLEFRVARNLRVGNLALLETPAPVQPPK